MEYMRTWHFNKYKRKRKKKTQTNTYIINKKYTTTKTIFTKIIKDNSLQIIYIQ